jgi:[CysO sulfur-carrier protein]-S-L-cysteine hydrolase
MVISQALLDDMLAHAREEFDAECCGLIAYAGLAPDGSGQALDVRHTRNVYASRKRFEIDKDELFQAYKDFEAEAREIGAIYHSHTHTAPYPSQTDINFAAKWPGVEWVIIGLAGDEPEVRCYFIDGPTVREVPLEVS